MSVSVCCSQLCNQVRLCKIKFYCSFFFRGDEKIDSKMQLAVKQAVNFSTVFMRGLHHPQTFHPTRQAVAEIHALCGSCALTDDFHQYESYGDFGRLNGLLALEPHSRYLRVLKCVQYQRQLEAWKPQILKTGTIPMYVTNLKDVFVNSSAFHPMDPYWLYFLEWLCMDEEGKLGNVIWNHFVVMDLSLPRNHQNLLFRLHAYQDLTYRRSLDETRKLSVMFEPQLHTEPLVALNLPRLQSQLQMEEMEWHLEDLHRQERIKRRHQRTRLHRVVSLLYSERQAQQKKNWPQYNLDTSVGMIMFKWLELQVPPEPMPNQMDRYLKDYHLESLMSGLKFLDPRKKENRRVLLNLNLPLVLLEAHLESIPINLFATPR